MNGSVVRDLVYDVGAHAGQDTAFYLAKGFKVVAFEANPDLLQVLRDRFTRELQAGRLLIEEGAVVARCEGDGNVGFFINEKHTTWSTADRNWADRNLALGAPSRRVRVRVCDFAAALGRHGVPHYMKIDIEGGDGHCLDVLSGISVRPDFVSVESSNAAEGAIAEINRLADLGYTRFAIVDQPAVPRQRLPRQQREGKPVTYRFERDSSGMFGDDLQCWMPRTEAIATVVQLYAKPHGWFDTHAGR